MYTNTSTSTVLLCFIIDLREAVGSFNFNFMDRDSYLLILLMSQAAPSGELVFIDVHAESGVFFLTMSLPTANLYPLSLLVQPLRIAVAFMSMSNEYSTSKKQIRDG